ncbi:MAG: D-glycerate dehydrogenase [Rhodobacteraceae bacterium]|nr:D-glycerate dehydrogenase [Paracoccaceae bacterium]
MNKILITRPLPEAVEKRAEKLGEIAYRKQTRPMNDAEMVSALNDFDIILPTLGDLFSEIIFTQVRDPRCKLLANFGVGYNHIDVSAARAKGLSVTNTPGAVTDATADIAMTLMLMTARRAGEGERLLRSGKWEGWHPTQMLGLHLSGKTVGIIGMGRIGQAIARRCHFGFGMRVVYVSRSPKELSFEAEKCRSIMDAASKADVIVVAVPGRAETKHLINDSVFAAMQSHAIFVNIARGDIVDEAALIRCLQNGQISGAGLDVYEFEPKVPDKLKTMENVTLFPHLGTASMEVRTGMGNMALDNIEAFINGQTPMNLV